MTDSFSMNYCRFGKGNRVFVMIPGLSLKPLTPMETVFEASCAALTEEFTVYIFDRRTDIPDSYSIEEMAEDTAAVIELLGLKDISLFGSSQGGMIAQCIAINHPDLVSALVLASSASRPNPNTVSVISRWINLAEERKNDELIADMVNAVYSPAFVEQYADDLLSAMGALSEEDLKKFLIVAAPIISFDCYDSLDIISCPVLVIGTWGDKVLTGKAAEEISEKIGCELFMYGKRYGHGVYDEEPDYMERVRHFLAR